MESEKAPSRGWSRFRALVTGINHPHQSLRITESGSGCKITCTLVTPAAIEGMFHYRHQLYMRKTEFLYIGYQSFRDLVIRIISFFIIFYRSLPTGWVQFIDRLREHRAHSSFPVLHPARILPIIIHIPRWYWPFADAFPRSWQRDRLYPMLF